MKLTIHRTVSPRELRPGDLILVAVPKLAVMRLDSVVIKLDGYELYCTPPQRTDQRRTVARIGESDEVEVLPDLNAATEVLAMLAGALTNGSSLLAEQVTPNCLNVTCGEWLVEMSV